MIRNLSVAGEASLRTAEIVATVAHTAAGQKRKYTGEDYIVHPRAVVKILTTAGVIDWRILSAAWLHDVVEDTTIDMGFIREQFGREIADIVWGLTNCGLEVGNRAVRFERNLMRLKNSDWAVKTIKIADLIDNTSSIVAYDPEFAKVYLREKRELLDRALVEGHHGLWRIAAMTCDNGEQKLRAMEESREAVTVAC